MRGSEWWVANVAHLQGHSKNYPTGGSTGARNDRRSIPHSLNPAQDGRLKKLTVLVGG